MGCVLPAGLGQNPARQAALQGGLGGYGCGADDQHGVRIGAEGCSALRAQAIATGAAETVVAGGMESMSNAPYLLPQGRKRIPHGRCCRWWTRW